MKDTPDDPFAPPAAELIHADEPTGIRQLKDTDLFSLLMVSRFIRLGGLAFLFRCFFSLFLYVKFGTLPPLLQGLDPDQGFIGLVFTSVIYAAAFVGCGLRLEWGGASAFLAALVLFLDSTFVTRVGIVIVLVYVVLIKGGRLFGSGRFSHDRLLAEIRRRKVGA